MRQHLKNIKKIQKIPENKSYVAPQPLRALVFPKKFVKICSLKPNSRYFDIKQAQSLVSPVKVSLYYI